MSERAPLFADSTARRMALKQKAAAARAHAAITKAWDAQIKNAAAGTVWRVTSAWIEQACGTRCADLTHVSTGHVRTIRCAATDSVGACRDRIVAE
jgi:hypothetical protein